MTESPPTPGPQRPPTTVAGALAWGLGGTICVTLMTQMILEDTDLSAAFVSPGLRSQLLEKLGAEQQLIGGQLQIAAVPIGVIVAIVGAFSLVTWLAGAVVIRALSGRPLGEAIAEWGRRGWRWWCLPVLWYVISWGAVLTGIESLGALVYSLDLWCAVGLAGWLAAFCGLLHASEADASQMASASSPSPIREWLPVLSAVALYTIVFTAMNWQLYRGLLVPHGDSAMYEEHLWNVLHGKGFRSYLDQGLFLGEHIQFIHLGLLPVYVLWPSHLLLELCESLALASTAVPVYLIARRHTGSQRAATWMAIATLLYFPLQYLDIAIDLKTFRPISFGVPLLLLAIDQMERGRWMTMAALLVLTLTAKEDFAIVIAPLGVWLCLTSLVTRLSQRGMTLETGSKREANGANRRREAQASTAAAKPASAGIQQSLDEQHCLDSRLRGNDDQAHRANPTRDGRAGIVCGAVIAVLATVYLFLAVKVLIPWFRGGETVHYARYFSRFGETPTEIVTNMVTQPGLLLAEFLTAGTLLYALRILVPLGGTPLLSATRLLVGAPLFLLLCLNELAQETPAPVHHFHAPLLPIVFWAAAAGLGNLGRPTNWIVERAGLFRLPEPLRMARFACLCALTTGLLLAIHPLSRKFWDSESAMYWRRLYVPGERAEQFEKVLRLIPQSARVASTDFVHPRFTHHERSYDYSDYLRKVAGYERRVPDDTDYIVIDTGHPYSTMHTPQDVPEFHQTDQWELLTTGAEPWFIVLKRREPTEQE